MTSAEILARYWTIAFSIDFMRSTIRFDEPETREANARTWFAAVPDVYKDDVLRAIEPAIREFLSRDPKMIERERDLLILLMHRAICQNVEPQGISVMGARWDWLGYRHWKVAVTRGANYETCPRATADQRYTVTRRTSRLASIPVLPE